MFGLGLQMARKNGSSIMSPLNKIPNDLNIKILNFIDLIIIIITIILIA